MKKEKAEAEAAVMEQEPVDPREALRATVKAMEEELTAADDAVSQAQRSEDPAAYLRAKNRREDLPGLIQQAKDELKSLELLVAEESVGPILARRAALQQEILAALKAHDAAEAHAVEIGRQWYHTAAELEAAKQNLANKQRAQEGKTPYIPVSGIPTPTGRAMIDALKRHPEILPLRQGKVA